MKKVHLCLALLLVVLTASSQKVYFIYIQTESEQPFFIRMNERVMSSTGSGYIILSKLVDSTYNFNIGFPQSKWPEQNFSVTLGRQDHGYLLKNFDDKGWGLFDLQSLGVQMAVNGNAEKNQTGNKDVSVFTDILSKAADDPSIKEKPAQPKVEEKKPDLVKKEEPKVEIKDPVVTKPADVTEIPVDKKEELKTEIKEPVVTKPVETLTQPVEKKEEPKMEINEKPVVKMEEPKMNMEEPYKISQVKKWSESSTTDGFGIIFIDDFQNGIKDTIRLVIPNPKPIVNMIKEEPKEEKKFLETPETITAKKEDHPVVVMEEKTATVKQGVIAAPEEKIMLTNNCSETATETDFFKLRKKMAGADKEDDMTAEAKKYFKTKCFSTAQIKNLSTLFLTDEGKYNFFDMAYKYVSDRSAFASLAGELKDEYYSSRFKAMLRN
ncbi:MAG: DUF4476 domain-containing protein [Bacteroidota bacterium]